MKVIESDTNETGQTFYILEKNNAAKTLITATVIGRTKFKFRYLLTGKPLTARDTSIAWRAVIDRAVTDGSIKP